MNSENSVTYLLTQVSTAYRNQLQKLMNEIGLHSGQVFVLFSLWKNDGQSQIELVKELNLTPPTVNKMVGSLSRSGFVKCEKCVKDSRALRVFLTEKGQQSKTKVEEQISKLEAQSLSVLNETEKLILLQLLGKLKDGLTGNIARTANDL